MHDDQRSVPFAIRAARLGGSPLHEMNKLASSPGAVSFANGIPAPELFPLDRLAEAFDRVVRDAGPRAFQYGPTEGYLPLRELITGLVAKFSCACDPSDIILTHGIQQALDLIGKVFIDPGDAVLLDDVHYPGAVDAFAPYQPRFIEAATSTGCSTDAIEEALTREPGTVKVVYVIPNFHNPTGRTMGERERARLADLADRHNIVLVEDDAYGELRYDGGHQPSVASFSSSGRVLSLGTFSKILAPGLRLGWIIAKGETRAKLLAAKQAADFYTSMVPQIVAHDAARDGFLEHHIDVLRQAYGARRDRLVRRLTERLSVPHRWITPSGGFFLWLEVPGLDGAAIFEAAAASRLVVIPGHMFGSTAASREAVRLSFSATPPAVIDEGTARLVEVVCEVAGRPLTDAAPRSSRH